MCLILLALNEHPRYDLVVAANRDEFYHRPTADAGFWSDYPHLLAGRDLSAGGTWMGLNTYGRIAMLTNYRDLSNIKTDAPSRGHLVSDYLAPENIDIEQYLSNLKDRSLVYNGYNLLFGDRKILMYFSNISGENHELSSGIHGLSNGFLNTGWPKVNRGKERFSLALQDDDIDPEELFSALYDDIKAPEHELPETGVGIDMEKMLSPIFIKSKDYGSRCSTVVMADKNGNWSFFERVYNPEDFSYRTNEFRFSEKQIIS